MNSSLAIIGSMGAVWKIFPNDLRCFALIALAAFGLLAAGFAGAFPSDPWTEEQTVEPAQLAQELHLEKDPYVTVIYVGVRTLYNGGHIPGAVFYGPGSTEQGIVDLKKYAATLPKISDVILYCGCCPLEKCPNLRPAFSALREMGFARLRVLILPTSFNVDWVEKGYPVQKAR
jgi:thiosulfate/3-mercaptopyruvate sulfurtransferase